LVKLERYRTATNGKLTTIIMMITTNVGTFKSGGSTKFGTTPSGGALTGIIERSIPGGSCMAILKKLQNKVKG